MEFVQGSKPIFHSVAALTNACSRGFIQLQILELQFLLCLLFARIGWVNVTILRSLWSNVILQVAFIRRALKNSNEMISCIDTQRRTYMNTNILPVCNAINFLQTALSLILFTLLLMHSIYLHVAINLCLRKRKS